MAAQSAPRVRRTAQNTQYTYNLNRRAHDVKTYPVLSPQGATILLYGHENGLTIVWRGGRRLKAPKKDSEEKKDNRNGGASADDSVMIIDLSDDDTPAPAKPFEDRPEFEDADPTEMSPSIDTVQTLDLAFGSAVRHIAVLPTPHCAAEDASWSGVELLKHKMVFAVTCLTAEVFIVTLPLTPPSHESKARPELKRDLMSGVAGRGFWGETISSLGGQAQYSDALAITLAKDQNPTVAGRSKTTGSSSSSTARVIVAAHSRQATGVLRLWDVTVGHKRGGSQRPAEPFQTDFLPSPLTGISFNPTHTTQLLTVASPQAVRIYDYAVPSIPMDEAEGPLPAQGSWLLSLYPPFIRGSGLSTARKPIVAASWIAHGRAVLALLADGQWGIWDIDGTGPLGSSSGGLFGKASAAIRGTATTTFSASGYLEGTSPLRNPGAQKSSGDLVPMTPHTRREVLMTTLGGGPEKLAAVHGGVDVIQLPGRATSGTGDESAVLWIGGADHVVVVIPFVSKFWDAQTRRNAGGGGNIFSGGAQQSRMVRLMDLSAGLLGERCCGVATIPRPQQQQRQSGDGEGINGQSHGANSTLPVEVLIRGESRLVIVREGDGNVSESFNSKLLGARKRILGPAQEVAPPTAIVAHPKPGAPAPPSAAALAQSIRGHSTKGRGSLFGKRPPTGDEETDAASTRSPQKKSGIPAFAAGLFDYDEPTFTQSMMASRGPSRDAGLGFVDQLEDAADALDDQEAAADRDVEEEILDIMEIDRALDDMEDRGSFGTTTKTQNVFFENS
ncbi:hypothetical protein ACKVV1_009511 [Pyricularia oryzae]